MLKSTLILISLVAIAWLAIVLLLYFFQRSLLFHPVAAREGIQAQEIRFENDGISLHGWVLNPGQQKALIYFGGNSEDITDNIDLLETLFEDHTVYLINYRGYGKSQGTPSEQGLFSDAIAIYDQIREQHASISLMGRSLGSGVAVYLASKRDIERLFLLTPYDSIAEVAQTHYPWFPIRHMVKDRLDSTVYAKHITAPTLIVTAEHDQVVPVKHALTLVRHLERSAVSYHLIEGAGHNNITSSPQYHKVLETFIDSSG